MIHPAVRVDHIGFDWWDIDAMPDDPPPRKRVPNVNGKREKFVSG